MTVEQYLDALRLAEAEDRPRKELAVHGKGHRMVPEEDANLETWPALQQPLEQLAELDRGTIGRTRAALEPRSAVQLPTEDENRALGREQRGTQRFEVVCGVDENGGALGVRAPPAGVALDQQRI